MVFKKANRLYLYNPNLRDFKSLNYDKSFNKYHHVYFITDLASYLEQFKQGGIVENFVEEFIKVSKTKFHFICIRTPYISKQTTRKFKDNVRTLCNNYNIPIGRFVVETMLNFYMLLDSGITYRFTYIPNSFKSNYVIANYVTDKRTLLRIAGIQEESIVDGIGLRYVVFVQGCPHHCKGCHNPETWDYDNGRFVTVEDLVEQISKNPMLDGVTFSGGEPFMQAKALAELMNILKYKFKERNKQFDYTVYTGFTLQELQYSFQPKISKSGKSYLDNDIQSRSLLLSGIDYIVDGEFQLDKRTLEARFRGSTNQHMYKQVAPEKFEEICAIE